MSAPPTRRQSSVRSALAAFFAATVQACVGPPEQGLSQACEQPATAVRAASIAPSNMFTPPRATTAAANPRPQDGEGPLSVQGSTLRLLRAALGQPFMLSPTVVVATNTPMTSYGQPRVVTFVQAGDKLALTASNTAAIYDGLPSQHLLQTFAIVAEDSDSITFLWDFGLQAIGQSVATAASDMPMSLDAYVDPEQVVLPVSDSYLAGATTDDEAVHLHQVARVRRTAISVDLAQLGHNGLEQVPSDATVHIYFVLSPYRPSARFVPKLSTRQHDVGFFEVAGTRFGDGGLDAYATRWDLSPEAGPVHFRITANVPDWLEDAVEEGITYWNRVAGRTIVAASRGADPAALGHEREVMVRWIPWRRAGFAQGTLQPHPRTGEIMRAEIYLTSAFAHGINLDDLAWPAVTAPGARGAMPGGAWVGSLGQPGPAMAAAARGARWLPHGFGGTPLCAFDVPPAARRAAFMQAAAAPLADVDDRRSRAAIADNLRLVVAHEVGHTLGLRHNFAASSQSDIDGSAYAEIWRRYLDRASDPGAAVSTSVMDYVGGTDGFLLGAYIREHTLRYDVAAIGWGYGTPADANAPEIASPDGAPLFCTDVEQFEGLVGCAAFDSGKNPLAGYLWGTQMVRAALPAWIVSRFVDGLAPEYPGDRKTPEQIVDGFGLDAFSSLYAGGSQQLFEALTQGRRVLATERRIGHLRVLQPDVYEDATRQQLATWLDELGGLPGFLAGATGIEADAAGRDMVLPGSWLVRAVEARLADPGIAQGTTLHGRHYALTAAEVAVMRALAPEVAAYLEQSILRDVILSLTGAEVGEGDDDGGGGLPALLGELLSPARQLRPQLMCEAWQAPLGMVAVGLVAEQADEVIGHGRPTRQGGAATPIRAALFRQDVRLAALRLMSPAIFGSEAWLSSLRERLHEHLHARLAQVIDSDTGVLEKLGIAPKGSNCRYVIPVGTPPALQRWAEGEIKVLEALAALEDGGASRLMETVQKAATRH